MKIAVVEDFSENASVISEYGLSTLVEDGAEPGVLGGSRYCPRVVIRLGLVASGSMVVFDTGM